MVNPEKSGTRAKPVANTLPEIEVGVDQFTIVPGAGRCSCCASADNAINRMVSAAFT
jgi:hypothetical protein